MTDEHEPTTQQPFDFDPYWHRHVILGEGSVPGYDRQGPAFIRLQLHRSGERYFNAHEYFPLSERSGKRIYFHAKPYILIPDITLTVALTQPTGRQTAFG